MKCMFVVFVVVVFSIMVYVEIYNFIMVFSYLVVLFWVG